jgi:protein-tyrosine phosphatase
LNDEQLAYYFELPDGLPDYYEQKGFAVAHIPTVDHVELSEKQLQEVVAAYERLGKPVLVHCSAGCTRTGRATEFIKNAWRLAAFPRNELSG